jgi:hypothetical protein
MARTVNFPQPPGRSQRKNDSFPNDLEQNNRRFFTKLTFSKYNYSFAGGAGAIVLGDSVTLPFPRKLNDNEIINWEEWSGAAAAGSALQTIGQFVPGASMAGSAISSLAAGVDMMGTFTGQSVNPFQFMMFKRPNFKEHTLQWTLAPNTKEESETLKRIINTCKKAALPSGGRTSIMMDYPDLCNVSFTPDNYLYKLKPCAIISVHVDYTGAGGPSFFNSGAPTVVNLTLQLKEIELWSKDNYQE